jgi:protein-S-isoprenylcysteine O-methyltransferase Ste14
MVYHHQTEIINTMFPFIVIWTIWFVSEIMLNRLFRSGNYGKNDQDKGSTRIIWITIGIANTLGILSAVFLKAPLSHLSIIQYSGLLLIVAGIIIRLIAIFSLGRFFTVDVTILDHHKLKTDGLYRLIRHPSYLGSLISFFGFGISLNNWISLIIIFIPVTLAMLYRIKIEEQLLTKQFGTEYSDYIKKTFRLIPWIY